MKTNTTVLEDLDDLVEAILSGMITDGDLTVIGESRKALVGIKSKNIILTDYSITYSSLCYALLKAQWEITVK